MTALVLGASAGVGRALARALAAAGQDLVLVARGEADLAAEAAHLRLSFGVAVDWVAADAADPAAAVRALQPFAQRGDVRALFFPVGMTEAGDDGTLPGERAVAVINANLGVVAAVVALFLPGLLAGGAGDIVGFGSVAAMRGRGSNVVYAAAKRGLEGYFESLRHRTSASGVRVQMYRLGYVATQMSYGQRLPFPAVRPEAVAARVVRGLSRDGGMRTVPWFWQAIGVALRLVPWPVYRRMQF